MAIYSPDDFFKSGAAPSRSTSKRESDIGLAGTIGKKIGGTVGKNIGQGLDKAAQGITNFVGAKGISEQYGADIARTFAPKEQKGLIDYPSLKEVTGSALQTGAMFVPGGAVKPALKGTLSMGGRGAIAPVATAGAKSAAFAKTVGKGAGAGYGMDVGSKLQSDRTVGESVMPGVGTAVGGGLPVAGALLKPANAIVGRLLKGLGSGLSGVSTETIDRIVSNPRMAQQASDKIARAGKERVLEDNARTIVNGVSKVRQEARAAYGNALGALKKEDIDPQKFRQGIQPVLDKYGISSSGVDRTLSRVEFSEQKNLNKASDIIDELSRSELDGASVRSLINKIDDAKYKVATTDERLSFNAFLKDLSEGLKSAVNGSTDKLGKMNAQFSTDMELAETVEKIFGKIKFKNLPEVVRASQKLDNMFAQKGLAPEVVDNFLKRIGISPEDFKTTEAVRQISGKESGANARGLGIGEVVQQATSAVVTPEMVKNMSILTGVSQEALEPVLNQMKPFARNALIQVLLLGNQDN